MKNLKQGGEKRQFNKSFFIIVQYLPSTLSARDDKNSGRLLVPNNNYKKTNKIQNPSPFYFSIVSGEEEEHFTQKVIHYTSFTNESQISPTGC